MLGFLARLQGTVFVPRGSRKDIARVNAQLCDALRDGRDLVVFPEGTSSDGTDVLAFRPAHFEALQYSDGEVAVAPVAILYTDGAQPIDVGWYGDMTFMPHLWSLMKRGGVLCRIAFGEAITAQGKDRKSLAAEAEAQVRAILDFCDPIRHCERSEEPRAAIAAPGLLRRFAPRNDDQAARHCERSEAIQSRNRAAPGFPSSTLNDASD